MIEAAVRQQVLGHNAVAPLVGQQMHGQTAPQAAVPPFLVYTLNDADRGDRGHGGLVKVRLRIEAVAPTYTGAKVLAEAVRQSLDTFRGNILNVWVRLATLVDAEDDGSPSPHAEEFGAFSVPQQWDVWYKESPAVN